MLLVQAFVFLLLTLPADFYILANRYDDIDASRMFQSLSPGLVGDISSFISSVLQIIATTNNVSHFLIYFASGTKFRASFAETFRCQVIALNVRALCDRITGSRGKAGTSTGTT